MSEEQATYEIENDERTRCEVFVRVMGYHRPISFWNAGKQQEHRDRVYFSNAKAEESGL